MKKLAGPICRGFLPILIFFAFSFTAYGQVLVQDFNELQNINQFQGNPPAEGQVDRINLSRSNNSNSTIFSLGADGMNQFLQIDKDKQQLRHFDRTTGINNEPFLRISFDFSVVSADMAGKFAAFFIGDTLNNNSFYPDREERWAQIGIFVNPDGSFYLTHEILFPGGDVFEVARTVSFSGNQRISIMTSNSEEDDPLVYTGPDGTPDLISRGFVHIWVGEDYKLVGPALRGESSAINAIKFLLWGNNQTASARMDNISVTQDIEVDALPVELLNFSANAAGEDVYLEWVTASEINSSYFEIERSVDGKRFEKIGKKAAAGESNRMITYSFIDQSAANSLAGMVYYRLHQVDLDGTSSYGPVIHLALPSGYLAAKSVFPNPFQDHLNVKLFAGKASWINIRLLSVQGDVVMEKQQYIEPLGQEQLYTLTCSDEIMAGVYMLEVRDGEKVHRYRVVKL